MPSTKHAILIFLKNPEPGRVKTRLAASVGENEATRIYQELVVLTFAALPTDAAWVVCYDPPGKAREVQHWLSPTVKPDTDYIPQADGDLGARLIAAFDWAFQAGYSRVAVVGTDCPELQAGLFHQAWEELDSHDCVIGPSADGGYYLLALNSPQPALFTEIAWSTERTLAETLARAKAANLRVALLPKKSDVDTIEDWKKFDTSEL